MFCPYHFGDLSLISCSSTFKNMVFDEFPRFQSGHASKIWYGKVKRNPFIFSWYCFIILDIIKLIGEILDTQMNNSKKPLIAISVTMSFVPFTSTIVFLYNKTEIYSITDVDDCEAVSCNTTTGTCRDLVNDTKCDCYQRYNGPQCDIGQLM